MDQLFLGNLNKGANKVSEICDRFFRATQNRCKPNLTNGGLFGRRNKQCPTLMKYHDWKN